MTNWRWIFERVFFVYPIWTCISLGNLSKLKISKLLRETCTCVTKIRCSLVKGGHQKEGTHDLFDASGVTPPNNLLVENIEYEVPYHLKTPVLSSLLYHYLTWWNTTSHIFFTQQLLVVLRVFLQKNTTKIPNFCIDVLYFVGFFPLKRFIFACCFALRNPVFRNTLALPRKTSKAHANARASKPKACWSSTHKIYRRVFADLVGFSRVFVGFPKKSGKKNLHETQCTDEIILGVNIMF